MEDVEVRASGVDEVRRVILGRVRDGDEFGPRRRVRGFVPDGASNRASRRRALRANASDDANPSPTPPPTTDLRAPRPRTRRVVQEPSTRTRRGALPARARRGRRVRGDHRRPSPERTRGFAWPPRARVETIRRATRRRNHARGDARARDEGTERRASNAKTASSCGAASPRTAARRGSSGFAEFEASFASSFAEFEASFSSSASFASFFAASVEHPSSGGGIGGRGVHVSGEDRDGVDRRVRFRVGTSVAEKVDGDVSRGGGGAEESADEAPGGSGARVATSSSMIWWCVPSSGTGGGRRRSGSQTRTATRARASSRWNRRAPTTTPPPPAATRGGAEQREEARVHVRGGGEVGAETARLLRARDEHIVERVGGGVWIGDLEKPVAEARRGGLTRRRGDKARRDVSERMDRGSDAREETDARTETRRAPAVGDASANARNARIRAEATAAPSRPAVWRADTGSRPPRREAEKRRASTDVVRMRFDF